MSALGRLRQRLAVIPGEHRPRHVRNGVIGLVVIAVLAIFGAYYSITGYLPLVPRGGNVVHAEFSTAFDLNSDTPVRVKGIDVGRVDGIARGAGGRSAIVTMRVNDTAERMLRSDAGAAVRERLILGGNMYIQLDPGANRAPLDGRTIPLSRTTTQVALDQLLGALRPDARQGLRGTFKGLRAALANGPAIQGTVDQLAPSFRQMAPAMTALRGRHPGDLGRLVGGFDRVLGSLDNAEGSLGSMIDSASTTFAVTAARGADINGTLDRAPTALATTRRELAGLENTLNVLDPLATALRPGARHLETTLQTLEPALTDTRVLLQHARPLVSALDPAIQNLRSASTQGVPLIASLNPSIDRVNKTLMPFLYSRDPQAKLRMYELPGPTVSAVDSLSGLYDQAGAHVAAFEGGLGPRLLHDFTPCSVYLTDPNVKKKLVCENLLQVMYSLLGGPPPPSATLTGLTRILGGAK
jgi:virulence factor Mce-like protein